MRTRTDKANAEKETADNDRESTQRFRKMLYRYEQMVRSSRDLIAYIDCDYIYRAISSSHAAFYGLKREEVIGRHVCQVVGEEAFYGFIKNNLDRTLSGESVDWQGWVRLGERPAVHMTMYLDPIVEKDCVIGIVVVARDTTETQRIETALRESEERFALAMQGVNDGLWDWNVVTNDIYCSPTWGRMLGYTDEAYTGPIENFLPLVHPDEKTSFTIL